MTFFFRNKIIGIKKYPRRICISSAISSVHISTEGKIYGSIISAHSSTEKRLRVFHSKHYLNFEKSWNENSEKKQVEETN